MVKLKTQGDYLEVHQAEQDANSTDKLITKCPENIPETGYKCECFNAKSLLNKKNELNILVEKIDLT